MTTRNIIQGVVIFSVIAICVGSYLDSRSLKAENAALLRSVQNCRCSKELN